jgi:hypothetical protein
MSSKTGGLVFVFSSLVFLRAAGGFKVLVLRFYRTPSPTLSGRAGVG